MVTLEEITLIRAPIQRCFDLARSVEVHLAGNIHCGDPAAAIAGVNSSLQELGDRVTWRARHFGIRWKLTSEITAMHRPAHFQNIMVRGPYQWMRHDHYFRCLEANQTEMRDVYSFAAPLGILGRFVELAVLRRYLKALLHERCVVIRQIAESADWQKWLPCGR